MSLRRACRPRRTLRRHSSRSAPCRWIKRFRSIEKKYGLSETDRLRAGREFLDTLTPGDRRKCYFHAADWAAIADSSVRIIEELGRCDTADYLNAVESSGLAEPELMWLDSLFGDPVFIGGGSYTNGQHRGCALRFSGAPKAGDLIELFDAQQGRPASRRRGDL